MAKDEEINFITEDRKVRSEINEHRNVLSSNVNLCDPGLNYAIQTEEIFNSLIRFSLK